MDLGSVLTWVTTNAVLLIAAAYALLNLANAVTKMTKSTADDSIVAKVWSVVDKVVDALSFLTKKDAVGTMKVPLLSRSKSE